MFTSIDKALVAFVMAIIYFANMAGYNFGLDENVVAGAVTAVTPILVWLFPNKTTPSA